MNKERYRHRRKFSQELFWRVLDRIRNLEPTKLAIQAEGMSCSGFYKALNRDDLDGQLRQALGEAHMFRDQVNSQASLEAAEAELHKRGIDGWQEAVYYQGEVVGTRQKYSDVCLIMTLKSLAPEKYGEGPLIRNHIQFGKKPFIEDLERQKELQADMQRMMAKLSDTIRKRYGLPGQSREAAEDE